MRTIRLFLLLVVPFVAIGLVSSCQSASSFPGVYAGVKLSISPMIGAGMIRTDVVILFRKDGTFTDELEEPDWKTAVSGKYAISGSKVILTFAKDGDKTEYKFTEKGNLDAGSFTLFKMAEKDKIPPGEYEFQYASGSGGIGTPVPYVGASGKTYLNFDGNGNFTTEKNSATVVAGDNIGGGTSKSSDGKGKYVLKDGELTLTFSNGAVTRHSFFAHRGDGSKGDAMAVIDGRFFFEKDEKDKKKTSKDAPAASTILESLRRQHGGNAIDNIKTVLVKGTMTGLNLVSRIDLENKKYRYEIYQGNKLIGVEQIEGNSGWQWVNGKRSAVTQQRIKEVKISAYTGISGLRAANNNGFTGATVTAGKNGEGYSVAFMVDGIPVVYVVNNNLQLLGDGYQMGNAQTLTLYSNYKKVGSLNIPFTETMTREGKKQVATINEYQVNVPLGTDWSVPQ
ncbi:MAG: hypothetical protein P0Y53_15030 [Candidatus Pseudobacter hemicellulosilyticus]|uniref:Uncharacterized protein n=1 Tax=Candidatus Pseudobacter hemicellulosilyticus TaxID=3121375 RepID=A0AAJ5WMH0_9BACT|nr:MAG: hypothetical protein P0Y53_15030 [Pseudobacter sp.]